MARRLKPQDRVGMIFNGRKIVNIVNINDRNKYVCECEICGSIKYFEYQNLKKEQKNHCGCLGSVRTGENNHFYVHGDSKSDEFKTWIEVRRRITDPNHKSYVHYRNKLKLDIDPRWLESYELFLQDMGRKPAKHFTLERIDTYKGYWRDNCKWATKKEQAQNKTTTFWCVYKGEKISLSSLCERLELKYITVYMRIKRGHSDPFFGITDVKIVGVIS